MYSSYASYLGGIQLPEEEKKIHPEKYEKAHHVDLKYKTEYVASTSDPKVWGPAFWFSLHVSAAHYPVSASPIVRERMKGRILALPYEVPCKACRPHAIAFIEKHRANLDQIVSGRDELVKFYVNFHNQVNKRYGKKEWTTEEAKVYYTGGAKITYLS